MNKVKRRAYMKKYNRKYKRLHPEMIKKHRKLYYNKHKERLSKESRENPRNLYLYGMTVEEYRALLKQQKGLCAICHKPAKKTERLAVDHCHRTGKVRGLLHRTCNTLLGFCKDDLVVLKGAIKYLKKHD